MSWSCCEFVGECTGSSWEVDANSACAFLYWSLILHLQWPGLGSVWARPPGHQFCGHIHLHLGHQVRISMFLHFGEITGTLFHNYQLAGQGTPWWVLLFSCAYRDFSYFPLSPRWLLLPYFQSNSEWVMVSRVVKQQLPGFTPCPLQIVPWGLFLEPKDVPQFVGLFSSFNEHHFMIL